MRVLVVEDSATTQGFLRDVLGRDGHEVAYATDGRGALAWGPTRWRGRVAGTDGGGQAVLTTLAQIPGGGLISTLVGLVVFIVVVGFLLRMLGWWGAGAAPGPGPAAGAGFGWGGEWGLLHGVIGLIVFLVVLGVLLRLVGVWV
jgi:hypothetical protein